MQVTLGGDRLGSGKEEKVDLHGFGRSTSDVGIVVRTTQSAGTLVPIYSRPLTPGSVQEIDLDALGITLPTEGPLLGSFKLQVDVFTAPVRLYQAQLHNNRRKIGLKMENIKLPQVVMEANDIERDLANYDNQQINPSSIWSHLDIRGLGRSTVQHEQVVREFYAVPFLAYWDIYKNYYCNTQEEVGAVIHRETKPNLQYVESVEIRRTSPSEDNYANLEQNGLVSNTPEKNLHAGYATTPVEVTVTPQSGQNINTDDIRLIYAVQVHNSSEYTYHELKLTDVFGKIVYNFGSQTYDCYEWKSGLNYLFTGWKYKDKSDDKKVTPEVVFFPLENLDNMRDDILDNIKSTNVFKITKDTYAPYGLALQGGASEGYSKQYAQEGLALKCYQSDLFNNWLNAEWIDGDNGVNKVTEVDVSDGALNLDALNMAQKVYNMLNRIVISGADYDKWQEVVYDQEVYARTEVPVYHGGLSQELVFEEVINTAKGGDAPLGDLAGRGRLTGSSKGGKILIKTHEMSHILVIASLTPRLDYSQGNDWSVNLRTMNDFHKPDLDAIGFQDLITDQMAFWDTEIDDSTGEVLFKSAGKQTAWQNYRTAVNKVRGNFANEESQMFMTLNRRYEMDENGRIKDLTTYIDPIKFNYIFADGSRDAQNFWMQYRIQNTIRQKMSARQIPNL